MKGIAYAALCGVVALILVFILYGVFKVNDASSAIAVGVIIISAIMGLCTGILVDKS